MRTRNAFVAGGLVMALLLGACQTPTSAPTPTTEIAQPTNTLSPLPTPTVASVEESPLATPQTQDNEQLSPVPTPDLSSTVDDQGAIAWVADGVVTEGEYASQADFGDIRLWWSNDDTYLYLAMEGDTAGWVAVGIDPDQGMQGANYVFGYVENDEAMIWDAYGTARTGPNHPPDEDLGGTHDIVEFVGVEEDGVTRFEAKLPLESGDQYDKALTPGESYPIIVAIGGEDSFSAYHLRYDRCELTLQ